MILCHFDFFLLILKQFFFHPSAHGRHVTTHNTRFFEWQSRFRFDFTRSDRYLYSNRIIRREDEVTDLDLVQRILAVQTVKEKFRIQLIRIWSLFLCSKV